MNTTGPVTWCVYSKTIINVSDFVNDKPFVREAQCSSKSNAELMARRVMERHPSKFAFAGVDEGPTWTMPLTHYYKAAIQGGPAQAL